MDQATDAWLKKGYELRDVLTQKRESLLIELRAVEDALARIPRPPVDEEACR